MNLGKDPSAANRPMATTTPTANGGHTEETSSPDHAATSETHQEELTEENPPVDETPQYQHPQPSQRSQEELMASVARFHAKLEAKARAQAQAQAQAGSQSMANGITNGHNAMENSGSSFSHQQ